MAKVLEWLRQWYEDRRPGALSWAYRDVVRSEIILIDEEIQIIQVKLDRIIDEIAR